MALAFQGSLLDGLASDGRGESDRERAWPGPLGALVRRAELARGAWVDLRPGWIGGADTGAELLTSCPSARTGTAQAGNAGQGFPRQGPRSW